MKKTLACLALLMTMISSAWAAPNAVPDGVYIGEGQWFDNGGAHGVVHYLYVEDGNRLLNRAHLSDGRLYEGGMDITFSGDYNYSLSVGGTIIGSGMCNSQVCTTSAIFSAHERATEVANYGRPGKLVRSGIIYHDAGRITIYQGTLTRIGNAAEIDIQSLYK